MAQPASLPRWATIGAVITVPPSGQLDTGWVVNQAPPAGYFNWYMNLVYQWTVYVQNLTAEVLTWTGQQTFSDTIIGNKGITLTAPSQATPPGPHSTSVGIDYTGASTTIVAGTGFSATGGASTNGVGGVGLRGEGGSGALEGGTGVVGVGQAGVTAGTGVIGLGGDASDAAGLGGYGARFTGGQNLTSDKGGIGSTHLGADGDLWNGSGAEITSGDLTGTVGSTKLNTAARIVQGDVYTSFAKTVRATSVTQEAASEISPGLQDNGVHIYPNTGIRVIKKGPATGDAFVYDRYGIDMDSGYMLRQQPINPAVYLAGTNLTLPLGTLSPWGILGAACSIQISSAGAGATFGFVPNSDRLNVTSIALPTSFAIRVNFTNSFLSADSYFIAVQAVGPTGEAVRHIWSVSARTSSQIFISARDFLVNAPADFNGASYSVKLDVMCFGR